MIVFWTYFDTLINVLTAQLEPGFINIRSFQGQVLQIVDRYFHVSNSEISKY